MANMNFNTSNEDFRGLMANGITYTVPRFQRDYSWKEEHWEDLWQDILGLFGEESESEHYMGYLVLQSTDPKQRVVIDGQQRITTLSVIILAVLANLKEIIDEGEEPEKNEKRAEQHRNSYIGYLDPVTLISRSKLELNRNNDEFYQNYLVPLTKIPTRNLKNSERLLRKAFFWFKDRLKSHLQSEDRGKELAELVETISEKLFFTVITVTDELNAFKVFETLNARGVRLSSTDLLKNYLFSVIYSKPTPEREMKTLDDRWEKVVGNLGGEVFPEFLRAFWNSKNKLVRGTELFKVIRKEIQTQKSVFDLVRQLDENANIYAALREPNDEFWADNKQFGLHVNE